MSVSSTENAVTTEVGGTANEAVAADATKTENPDVTKTAAESSSADDKGEKTPAQVLDELFAGKGASPASESSEGAEGSEAEAADAAAEKDKVEDGPLEDPTEQELAQYKPKTRKRMEQLLHQRNEATRERDAFAGDAQAFRTLRDFMDDAGLDKDEVNAGFEIMRLTKNDPARALELLMPVVNDLRRLTGHVLPPELQAKVEAGNLSEEDARALSVARSETALEKKRREDTERKTAEKNEQTARETHVHAVASAVSDWERSWSGSDPDYKAKQPRVAELMKLEVYEKGYPASPQDAVARMKAIRAKVDAEFAKFAPRKAPVNPPADGGASSLANRKPQSSLDAINLALSPGG